LARPSADAPLDLFLGTLSQSFRHPGLRARRDGIDVIPYCLSSVALMMVKAAMPAFTAQ
jgi:hypothetical protein